MANPPHTRPPRRMGALVLIVRDDEHILLVKPSYRSYPTGGSYQLVGGNSEPGEPPHRTAAREAREEIGWRQPIGNLLLVEYAREPAGDGLNFVYATRTAPADYIPRLGAMDDNGELELTDYRWARLNDLSALCQPYQQRRITQALHNLRDPTRDRYSVRR